MKGMDVKSEILMSFISQEDRMKDQELDQILEYQQKMTVQEYTFAQAQEEYKKTFSKTENGEEDTPGNSNYFFISYTYFCIK